MRPIRSINIPSASPLVAVLLVLTLAACSDDHPNPSYGKAEWVETAGSVPERTELAQNWGQQTRNDFWFTSQGARFIPYAWFTWLEQADTEELFRHTDNVYRLGYIPERSSQQNPAGLPIGFALNTDRHTGDDWLGFTCAACHTGEIEYAGQHILVEGAPTLGNFMRFFNELLPALQTTYDDSDKFSRFAAAVLGEGHTTKQDALLKEELKNRIRFLQDYLEVNDVPNTYPDDFAGHGRIDAFGIIQNMATAFAQNKLSNKNVPDAPVSYPVLWGAHQSSYVQWNGSLSNKDKYGFGPITRNVGEVVGVFGGLSVERAPIWQRPFRNNVYGGHVEIANLGQIESWLRDLRSPKWPENILPPVNQDLAAQGEALYRGKARCIQCHQIVEPENEHKLYPAHVIPVSVVGTEALVAENAVGHDGYTFLLEGTKKGILVGEKFEERAPAIEFAFNGTFGLLLNEPITAVKAAHQSRRMESSDLALEAVDFQLTDSDATATLESQIEDYLSEREKGSRSDADDEPGCQDENGLCYKARPHTGIWSSAPYLHNGSVPTLRDMLRVPEDRPTEFWVGSREYDPVNVGFVSVQVPGVQQSRFSIYKEDGIRIQPGNSNQGHLFGTDLSEQEKEQLLEFLKTL